MQMNDNYKAMLGEFERLFDFLNERLFDAALQKPVLTSAAAKNKLTLGTFTKYLAWTDADGNGSPEINISAQYNLRPFKEVAETMLHEMCHLYAYQNGINDTNSKGVRHNRNFKNICETHGLKCEYQSAYRGFSHTTFLESTAKMLEEDYHVECAMMAKNAASLQPSGNGAQPTRKKRERFVYICPDCGAKITLYHEMSLICGDCNKKMERDTTK